MTVEEGGRALHQQIVAGASKSVGHSIVAVTLHRLPQQLQAKAQILGPLRRHYVVNRAMVQTDRRLDAIQMIDRRNGP